MKTYSAWAAVFVATLAATPGATAPQLPADSAAGDSLRKRPAYVNNAEQPYFPPVFNQDGGSCGSASRIGYMFTYEINALRGDTARTPDHIYPTHFTWLLTNSNSGKEGMSMANGVPNATTYGGTTYSRLFGNQDCGSDDFGWMQGYDKWLEAMQNRISHNSFSPYGLDTEEGRELVKNWLWNHCGDTTFHAGGICGIGVASACKQGDMADDPAGENKAAGLVGKKYVTRWGDGVDHALTIVGYSINATIVIFDRIRENLKLHPAKDIRELVNLSITETLSRSVNTSLTTFIMVLCLYILGVSSIREFAMPLMVGIVAGAYSSVCITGPLWYDMSKRMREKAAKAVPVQEGGRHSRKTKAAEKAKEVK